MTPMLRPLLSALCLLALASQAQGQTTAATAFWNAATTTYRRQVTHWALSAKQEATRERRLAQLIDDSAAGRLVSFQRYGEVPKWAERAAEAARAAASASPAEPES